MKSQASGFVLIDALLAFLIASLLVSLLVNSTITSLKQRRYLEDQNQKRKEWEEKWWQNSNAGCRDTCLIDELTYPWN